MQGTTYTLENHVHILKYFIQLKYYTVNCLQLACVCVCFQNTKNGQLHKPLESSGMYGNANDNLLELAIIGNSWNSYDFHNHVGYTCKCQRWPLLLKLQFPI